MGSHKKTADEIGDRISHRGSIEALQTWQIYSGLFLTFWIVSAYFDHSLITAILCLISVLPQVFGCVGEQLTSYMYCLGGGGKAPAVQVTSLLSMAREEANLVPSLTEMAKMEVSGQARLNEEEEEGPPPPVPARKDDIAERLGSVNDKLEELARERTGPGPTQL